MSYADDIRFDDINIIFLQFAAHGIEGVRAVGADDGAAGPGELGGCAELTCDLDHAAVLFAHGRSAYLAAEVEISVEQRGQEAVLMRSERVADFVGQGGPFANSGVDFRHAGLVIKREAAVEDLGALGEVGAVGDVKRQIIRDLDRFVDAVAVLFHVSLVEIHVNRRLIDLRHAVLKSGFDAELVELDGQHEVGEDRLRNFDLEEADHGAHGGRDDRGGPRHAEAVRDVRLIAQREVVAAELDVLLLTVGVKCLYASLEQTDATVVAELRDAAREIGHVLVSVVVEYGRQDLEIGRFVQRDLGAVVAEYERDRLAEIPVGRVADERGARICFFADDHVCVLNLPGTSRGCRLFPRHLSGLHSSGLPG